MDMKHAINKAIQRENLDSDEAERACAQILRGEATPAQIGALLIALRMKGETVDEILGFARAMREAGTGITHRHDTVIDTCGTGGDRHGTFNVSTAAAFVAAAGGVPVAKHGNRAVSSKTGSADVLRELGVKIDCSAEVSQRCIDEINICFLFAPHYHGAMRHAAGPRQEIGVRTIFNMIGPLTNPAGASRQVLGVYGEHIMEPLAKALQALGTEHSLIVHSSDGLDEISVCEVTHIVEVHPGKISIYNITPHDLGLETYPFEQLLGGDAEANAKIIRNILGGHDEGGRAAMVAANAGAALFVGGKAATLREGTAMA
ncbi:anthranilate phosphoribosyltransferase, partial [Candidatus Sumerlaeota bacterium]|nr:anthranilate phosphoribosyltransferase [Candidatus Sumerlaeota bacterium]